MSSPPPPADPNSPVGGDPMDISTWIKIGGVLILVIVVVTVTQWNRGGGGSRAKAPPTPSQTPVAVSPSAAPDGMYEVIFDGSGTAHDDRPDGGQTYRSADAIASWHLEYMYGQGQSGLPDLTTSTVNGSGHSKAWRGPGDCTAGSATYTPRTSVLEHTGPGDSFRIGVPLAGDLLAASGCKLGTPDIDPFSRAWESSCSTTETCQDLGAFWSVTFTIKAGQTGTVVTKIPTRTFNHVTPANAPGGENAMHSWSGTITVVAQ